MTTAALEQKLALQHCTASAVIGGSSVCFSLLFLFHSHTSKNRSGVIRRVEGDNTDHKWAFTIFQHKHLLEHQVAGLHFFFHSDTSKKIEWSHLTCEGLQKHLSNRNWLLSLGVAVQYPLSFYFLTPCSLSHITQRGRVELAGVRRVTKAPLAHKLVLAALHFIFTYWSIELPPFFTFFRPCALVYNANKGGIELVGV